MVFFVVPMDEPAKDSMAGSVGLLPVDSLNFNHSDYAPSANDLAWLDSCLIEFTEAPDIDWSSFKEPLSEVLNVPEEPFSLLAAGNESNNHTELGDNRTFPSSESMATVFCMLTDDHSEFMDKDVENLQDGEDDAVDNVLQRKNKDWLKQKMVMENNALLPDHTEFAEVENSNLGTSLGSSAFEVETSSHDIFKVWDLGVSDEQDDFTKELNKAIEEPRFASTSGVIEGLQNFPIDPLDYLTARISDLSLGKSSN